MIRTLVFLSILLSIRMASAACDGTLYVWDSGGGNDNWNTTANWNPDGDPNGTGVDVQIVAGQRDVQVNQNRTVGCMEVSSGWVTDRNNRRLIIRGDYFRALTTNTLQFDSNSFWLEMDSTDGNQTLELVDSITNVEISGSNDTTITDPFEITNHFEIDTGWTGNLYIEADVLYSNENNNIIIPAGTTVEVRNGASFTSFSDWVVNGTLKVGPGSSLRMGNGETITVNAGGTLILEGAPGNPATISSQDISDTYTFNVAGILNAEYFQIARTTANGINVTGTIQKLDEGEFHYIANNGHAMTIGAAANLPTTMNTLGFFNDGGNATVNNIDADAYNGTATTINSWSGSVGGAANEDDANGKINWGSQAGTKMTLIDASDPPQTINQNNTATLASFSFGLNQSDTATNITEVVITQNGTAGSSDISWIDVYRDAAGSKNCVYNGGTDVSITGEVQLSGFPPSYTVTIPSGDVSTSSDTDFHCIHVRARTTTNAQDAKTIQFSIQSTDDVTNSEGYDFSNSASPPISVSPPTIINGDPVRIWEGANSSSWDANNNWSGGEPTNGNDCQVGIGQSAAQIDKAQAQCQNANLLSGGSIDFNDTSNELAVYASLDVKTGYNFLNTTAGPGVIAMRGAASQTFKMETEFPGDVVIANTGAAGNDIVNVAADSTVTGDITISNGKLRINDPYTMTVKGDMTCENGAELEIMPGATLAFADNSTLTIDSGCTFTIVGDTSNNAVITSTGTTAGYNVVVNGDIEARYYTFDKLGTGGLSIESGATIDSTNHLQDGTFTYPVDNNSTLLLLKQQVPTNTLNNMTFSLQGSSATGTTNVDTTGASAGTLTLNDYTGDIAGLDYDTDPSYLLSWLGATNTLDVTQEGTGPSTVDAGSTYTMGYFGFQQTLAGASYADTDITSLKVTLTGTASSNDIDEVKIYYDSNCDGLSGTLIGNGSLSGNPASRTFSIAAGDATIEADNSTPPQRCIYVEYIIAAGAVDGNTAGVKISAAEDISNSQGYAVNSSTLPPITLGSEATIVGANLTSWTGSTDTDWFTAGNWSAGVPDSTKTCEIDDSANDPVIDNSGTAACKSMIIGNGTLTLQNSVGAVLEIYGSFDNTGTFTQNDGTFRIRDDGVTATNQGINSNSTIDSLTFNKTAGGEVFVNVASLTVDSLTMPSGSDFDFRVPNSKTLVLPNSTSLTDGVLLVDPGGEVQMGSGTTLTIGAAAKLEMVGTSSNLATMTSVSGGYNVTVNGEIQARYFQFDHTNGVSIESGATISTEDPLQNGEFIYPVANNTTMLELKRKVPTDTINSIKFDLGGSSATGTTNIDTTGAAAGSLSINSFLGDLGGPSFDTDPSYVITWSGAQNTIELTQEATSPASVNAGSTYTMGRFGFQQTLAGGSYNDANLTSLKLTLTGTGSASDVDAVRIFADSDCDSTGGTQIGSGNFSGNPASRTFTIAEGDLTIEAHATTPPKTCIYVEYDIASGAINANTVGVEIAADSHMGNDQGYDLSDNTPTPVNLGSASSITGSTVTTWDGSSSTDWFTAANWSAGVPDSTTNCVITNQTNDPNINGSSGTASCKQVTIESGAQLTLQNGTGAILDVYGNFVNSGVLTQNDGDLRITDSGGGNNTISSTSAISSLTFNKTSSGTVSVASTVLQIADLTFPASSNFTFDVPSGKTLILTGGTDVVDATFSIAGGGTVKLSDAQTFTVSSGGTLSMVGSSGNPALMTGQSSSDDYNVVVNGTIEARHYQFEYLGVNGVSIESGATIDSTNHLQDGSFTHPVNNSSTLLLLKRQVPTNTMDNMNFDLDGSGATGTTNINTTGASAGTLTIDAYTGDLAGASFDTDPAYAISWTGAQNTIDLTQEATGPSSLDAGSTYNMGRFGFQQTQAGASYSDVDITSLRLTLTGTATSSDISEVRIYYDSDCNSSAGTLIGSGTFNGSPANRTFTLSAGDATIHADASSPPLRCIYVEYDISEGAANNNTAGVRIHSDSHVVTDLGYEIADGTPTPVTLGTAGTIVGATTTYWTGTTSTDWFTAGNWSAGVPDSTKSCNISDVTNDPSINGASGTAQCKNVTISNGIVTMVNSSSAVWEVYGNFDHNGTLTQNDGVIRLEDGGTGSAQTLTGTSSIGTLTFDKTTGGSVRVNDDVSISTLTFPGSSNFEFQVPSGVTLTLPNGFSLPAGTFNVQSGGTVEIGNNQTVTINGGTFKTSGINDAADQNLSNKGTMTVSGSGEWAFSATSGNVELTGFLFRYLDVNGLNISGSADLDALNGGQFTNLKQDYVTPVKAIQLNTTGSVPSTANNIGWMWDGPNKANVDSCCAPETSDSYYIVYAPNCSSATITFDQWFGDFATGSASPDTEDKIYDTDDGQSCQISVAASASPVSLLSFTATGYKQAVSLDWETASEIDHAGFNVFRSTHPTTGYIQINGELIRNYFDSTSFHGRYRFVDSEVTNGQTYYYKIEDVAYNGATEMHGPVNATPLASLGDPPADPAETNSGISAPGTDTGNAPDTGVIGNSDIVDLGNGVHILARTSRSLRLEIVPPTSVYETSTWNGSFEHLTVPGYSSITEPGHPEIVERSLLIEVDPGNSTVEVVHSAIEEDGPAAHPLQPAPSWAPNSSNILEPTYTQDASAYSSSSFAPSSYFRVAPELKEVSGKKYIQIKVQPVKYKASTGETQEARKITLDLALDGQATWRAPNIDYGLSPSAVEGNLIIRYAAEGIYELKFDDIDSTGLSGPFENVGVEDLRAYYHGQEIAIQTDSVDAVFNSGDSIIFYAPYEVGHEENFDQVILSSYDELNSRASPLRMAITDASPAGASPSNEVGTSASSIYEWNWGSVFTIPMADMVDHFFMPLIYAFRGGSINPVPSHAYHDIPMEMPGLIQTADQKVTVIVRLVARAQFAKNATHHLGIYINNIPFLIDEKTFQGQGLHTVIFQVPHSYFFDGTNNIRVRAMGDMVPVGDVEIINIDRVEAHYRAHRVAVEGQAKVLNSIPDSSFVIDEFSTNDIAFFDVTGFPLVQTLSNVDIQPDGPLYTAELKANWQIENDEVILGRQIYGIEDGAYHIPSELALTRGSTFSLKDELGADLIVLGGRQLLDAAQDLITARRNQGLRVVEASLEQVYAEFNHGLVSSHAIRDFLFYARDNWEAPRPKYLLILGDATFDPRDHYGHSPSRNTMPIPIEKGLYLDFGNDNWFVTDEGSNMPFMAVGRLPSSDPAVIYATAQKILDYESGQRAPTAQGALKQLFVSDSDSMNEGFERDSQKLATSLKAARPAFQTEKISRTQLNDGAANGQILNHFDQAPLMITYLGHGAEDRWASQSFFDIDDAANLNNQRLPIVTALNCLNSLFYDPDPSAYSLGEKLMMNPDGGAIAFWGSTTMTIPPVQIALATGFLNEVASKTSTTYQEVRLGDLALTAKTSLGDTPSTQDTLRSWTLFGDPSMPLPETAFEVASTTPAPSTPSTPSTPTGPNIDDPTVDQPSTPSTPTTKHNNSGGGGGGCAVVVPPPPGGGNGPGPWALTILLLPLAILVSRRRSEEFN